MEWSLGLRLKEPGTPCNYNNVTVMVDDLTRRGYKAHNHGGGTLNVKGWTAWNKNILDIIWVHKNARSLWPKRVPQKLQRKPLKAK